MEIPYGETQTYGQIANKVAARVGRERMAAQAIGNACKRNPIPLFVPCHRVVAAQGRLGGFSLGLDRKRFLLELEARGVLS